jgi:hypothetical protein
MAELAVNSKLETYALNVIRNLDTFTADDLHVLENEITLHKRDKRVIGALLKSLQSKGYIIPIGYRASKRRECHGRPIVLWKNVEGA